MRRRPDAAELVDAQVVRPLRRSVLRPDRPPEEARYPGDDDLRSAHAAVRHIETRDSQHRTGVEAVGTVVPEAPPWEPDRVDGWRVRGMATRPEARRRGLGSLVLAALLDHVAAQGGGLVWCNARVLAQGLYRRAGFTAWGGVFDIPGIGPHVHMWRTLGADDLAP